MSEPIETVQMGMYHRTGNSNTYSFVPGTCVLPVAEEPPTSPTELAAWSPIVVFQLHAAYRIRRLTNLADKENNPPVVPAPGDTGSFVFVGGAVTVTPNFNNSVRNYDWAVGCEYTYVENCVSRIEDGLVLGGVPYPTDAATINQQQYQSVPPQIGAVAHAGTNAVVGYNQGRAIVGSQSSGALKTVWGYNTLEFFPGTLFSTDLANAGTPVSPVTS